MGQQCLADFVPPCFLPPKKSPLSNLSGRVFKPVGDSPSAGRRAISCCGYRAKLRLNVTEAWGKRGVFRHRSLSTFNVQRTFFCALKAYFPRKIQSQSFCKSLI